MSKRLYHLPLQTGKTYITNTGEYVTVSPVEGKKNWYSPEINKYFDRWAGHVPFTSIKITGFAPTSGIEEATNADEIRRKHAETMARLKELGL